MPRAVVESAHAPDPAAIARYVTPRCNRRFVAHVGGSPATRILARLQPVWFVPSQGELGRGARWFRCDVVGFAAANHLAELPRRSRGLLAQPEILDTYGLCSTAAPSRDGDHQVICERAHTWRAFSVIRLDSSRGWPSQAQRAAARRECKAQARARQGYPLRWTYGWQRPTRSQWRDGRQWGYCWSPER